MMSSLLVAFGVPRVLRLPGCSEAPFLAFDFRTAV